MLCCSSYKVEMIGLLKNIIVSRPPLAILSRIFPFAIYFNFFVRPHWPGCPSHLAPLPDSGNPIGEPTENLETRANLEPRRDKVCKLHSRAPGYANCRAGAGTGYRIKHIITEGESFTVGCRANREEIEGRKQWDYIPKWKCWVSTYYTSNGCESKSFSFYIKNSSPGWLKRILRLTIHTDGLD